MGARVNNERNGLGIWDDLEMKGDPRNGLLLMIECSRMGELAGNRRIKSGNAGLLWECGDCIGNRS